MIFRETSAPMIKPFYGDIYNAIKALCTPYGTIMKAALRKVLWSWNEGKALILKDILYFVLMGKL